MSKQGTRTLKLWLLALAAMTFVAFPIGAITRLSESGLAIMEWAPLRGILPPLGQKEWQRLFALYQQSAEFRLVHAWMELADFQRIFWWEYIHRIWGRLIALVFVIPFGIFLVRRTMPTRLLMPLCVVFLLGAAQGALGWFMVQSGFANNTDVSPYRLLAHFGLALTIYLWIWLLCLQVFFPRRTTKTTPACLRGAVAVVLGLVLLTTLSGVLVAGLNAGLIYNTWPDMHGAWLPTSYSSGFPWWRNALANPVAVQFHHRWLAVFSVLAVWSVVALAWRERVVGCAPALWAAFALLATLQLLLGIWTLLHVVAITPAVLHQMGALLLLSCGVAILHQSRARGNDAERVDARTEENA